MNEVSAPSKKKIQESSPAPSTKWRHNKKGISEPEAESAGALILDFPDSRSMGNKCLLFKPPSLW